jgi:hypothetical protein
MRYLCVKNWAKLQHQSDKPLPWIKFFTALLAPTREPAYSDLPDATKALLHHIWLMARVFNNRIPESWLTKEKLNLKSRLTLDPLIDSGYIWFEDEKGIILSSSHERDARSGLSASKSLASELPEGESEGKQPDSTELKRLRDAIRSLGLRVTSAVVTLLATWAIKPGLAAVLGIIERNRESICAADHPMQYLAAIVKRHGEKASTPEPEVVSAEPTREETANLVKRDVYRWLDSNGDPDTNDIARVKFNAEWSQIGGEDYKGCRWERWLSVAREFGFDAKPRQKVSA